MALSVASWATSLPGLFSQEAVTVDRRLSVPSGFTWNAVRSAIGGSVVSWRMQRQAPSSIRFQAAEVAPSQAGTESRPGKRRVVGSGVRFVGSGSAVPAVEITNTDLSKLVETNDEWIATRTGIRKRRVLSKSESLCSMAAEAAQKALDMGGVAATEVEFIILCTSSPDDLFGTACQVQAQLGAKNAACYDLTAACSGFVMGLVNASSFIKAFGYKNVLVIGADALSRYVDWTDRGTCILFGDAAGAVLVQRAEGSEDNMLGFDLRSDGLGWKHLNAAIETPSSNGAATTSGSEVVDAVAVPAKGSYKDIQMSGRDVFKFAVRAVPQVLEGAMADAGVTKDDLDWLLLHQANQRILDAVADRFAISHEQVISNLANYGNTSAASIPLALDEAVRVGKIKAGDTVATAGFGAGLSWGSAIIRWG